MANNTSLITALEKAIASGARSIRTPEGTSITYHSLADMRAALQHLKETDDTVGENQAPRVAVINIGGVL